MSAPRHDPPFTSGNASWHVVRELREGGQITIRPIAPDDRDALRTAFLATSPRTRYLRFLGAVGELDDAALTYLTCVDQERHVALVATITSPDLKTERGAGVARFIRVDDGDGPGGVAEAAITVSDDAQRRGIGTALAKELVRAARARGIHTLRAEVLEGNAEMRAILEGAGATRGPASDGVIAYDLELEPPGTIADRARRVMRGAAQTMAVTIRRLGPPSAAAAAASGDEADRAERDR
jgi:RimJ/RimL family protein N-acetyltransferase